MKNEFIWEKKKLNCEVIQVKCITILFQWNLRVFLLVTKNLKNWTKTNKPTNQPTNQPKKTPKKSLKCVLLKFRFPIFIYHNVSRGLKWCFLSYCLSMDITYCCVTGFEQIICNLYMWKIWYLNCFHNQCFRHGSGISTCCIAEV